jgi:hypothetical protein
MRKTFVFAIILIILSCTRMNTRIDIPELGRLIKYGEAETLEITFKDMDFSDQFMANDRR